MIAAPNRSVAGIAQRVRRRGWREFAVSRGDLADRSWLRALLADAGLSVVVAADLSVERALRAAGEAAAALLVVEAGSRAGVELEDLVRDQVAWVRALSPHVGVAVVTDAAFDPRLLPPRTWLLTPRHRPADVAAMVAAVAEHRADHHLALRPWPDAGAPAPAARRPAGTGPWPGAIPNFNIRHPGMLVSIARVAVSLDTPVVGEISPQEALLYYRSGAPAGDHRAHVREVLTRLRSDVDFVREATGADVRLHLDHCDDPDLIVHALRSGFDSIMADGSGHPLGTNIRFVQRAVAHASEFGVPVEGEVGSIDPHGRRDTSKTEPADARTFVERTGVHHLGINIGQVHGSDYDYARSRRALRDIAELDRTHGREDVPSLYRACAELDETLALEGVRAAHPDRRCLHATRDRLISRDYGSLDELLAGAYSLVPAASGTLVAELERRWNRRRLAVATRRARLYAALAPGEVGIGRDRERLRFVDLDLLREVGAAIAGTGARLVLHGGSSIPHGDLRLLGRCGVARVNFGSRPFAGFVHALAARRRGGAAGSRPATLRSVVRFLDEHGSDWRDWTRTSERFLDAYDEELRRTYFTALTEREDAEEGE